MSGSTREHPSLPQNDTPPQEELRREQLLKAQSSYQWTTGVPTLKGVPLASQVPRSDHPTVSWKLKVGKVALDVAVNQLAVKFAEADKKAEASWSQISGHLKQMGEGLAKVEQERLPETASLLHKAEADILQTIHAALVDEHLRALSRIIDETSVSGPREVRLKHYKALFATLPLPGIASRFESNESFARMRVAGPNSVLIRGISALPARFPLSAAQYSEAMPGDSLAQALADGRLYVLDYEELARLEPGTTTEGTQKYVFAPIALFAVPAGGQSLTPVAIQCGQDPRAPRISLVSTSRREFGGLLGRTDTFGQGSRPAYRSLDLYLIQEDQVLHREETENPVRNSARHLYRPGSRVNADQPLSLCSIEPDASCRAQCLGSAAEARYCWWGACVARLRRPHPTTRAWPAVAFATSTTPADLGWEHKHIRHDYALYPQ